MQKLTQQEADDLWQFVEDEDYEPFELKPATGTRPAKITQVRGATAGEYVKYVVKRIPAVKAQYVEGVKRGVEQAKAEAARAEAEAAGRGVQSDLGQAQAVVEFDLIAHVEGEIDHGQEAKAALVAVCVDRAGDVAFERSIVCHPRFAALAARADYKTRGADPAGFSSDVAALIIGLAASTAEEPTTETV